MKREKERQEKSLPSDCFTSQMVATAQAGTGQNQEPGIPSWFLTRVAKVKYWDHLPLLSKALEQGTAFEVWQLDVIQHCDKGCDLDKWQLNLQCHNAGLQVDAHSEQT